MGELWELLLSAQASENGIPESFTQQKKEEIKKRMVCIASHSNIVHIFDASFDASINVTHNYYFVNLVQEEQQKDKDKDKDRRRSRSRSRRRSRDRRRSRSRSRDRSSDRK